MKRTLEARTLGVSTLTATGEWMRRMTAECYSGSAAFLEVLDPGKENTRISLQARLQLFTLSRVEGVLAPSWPKT